ncbi:MAG: glycosyltransferase family 2 protein [Planctomycetota bacterium]|nr:MAG: glycosyltransferase family 2 protein [Planctomycetota bacterium]REJ93586.1 MAG: glycosyltransferase family 2 protein [Planctomycetota bacterium]REK19955.1 MAG: glycosyltransferase family 2 protein [Planctomycetota bacterium]REK27522.1 MAG: glycosyltransferase family 2 protein [Planctomycetota bacterium]
MTRPDQNNVAELQPGNEQAGVFLSVVIPAHNEEGCVRETVESILAAFAERNIADCEILVINDNSTDGTEKVLQSLANSHPQVRYINNDPPHGFGFAVRRGLNEFRGECVCIMMADLSDSPEDLLRYYDALKNGAECVFGSRFIKGARVIDYPKLKLYVNRLANWFIKVLFGLRHNDITNAFKAYRRDVIDGLRPIVSHHFNLTVELPLKAIIRGYQYETIPISWRNRRVGSSKLQMREMGSRYLFIVLYALLEKLLAKGDYYRR